MIAAAAAAVAGDGAPSPIITPGTNMRDLLLQLENFLRKRVDFGVLFVNLFCQRFKLGGLSRFCRIRRWGLRRSSVKRERAIAEKIASFIAARFCHRQIYLTSGFAAWARKCWPLNRKSDLTVWQYRRFNASGCEAPACVSNICS